MLDNKRQWTDISQELEVFLVESTEPFVEWLKKEVDREFNAARMISVWKVGRFSPDYNFFFNANAWVNVSLQCLRRHCSRSFQSTCENRIEQRDKLVA